MGLNIDNFIIDPNDIDEIFDDYINKNPFALRQEYKMLEKEFAGISRKKYWEK